MRDPECVTLLPVASLFLTVVSDEAVEDERLALEAEFEELIEVHTKETVTRSGTQMTRVEWRVK